MPHIQGYKEHILPEGQLDVRASPDQFGAQIGASMQRFGGAIGEAADTYQKIRESKDVTNVHTNMAKAREDFSQKLQDDSASATPGDDTFAQGFATSVSDWVQNGADSVATPAGKRLWATLGANLVSEFHQRAIGVQGDLAAEEALVQNAKLKESSGSTVFRDPSMLPSVLQGARDAINDPKSIYAKLPAPKRERLLDEVENGIKFSACMSHARNNSEAILGALAPDQLALFKPWESVLQAHTAPGGHVSISPETLSKASEFTMAAASKGLNPNILMAQNDASVAKAAPATLAAQMGKLVNYYAGDYSKALAAFSMGGTKALDSILKAQGADWEASIPTEARSYVDSVLEKSGAVASSTPQADLDAEKAAAPATGTQESAKSAYAPFNGLTWEQQDRVVREAIQTQEFKMRMVLHAREEQQFQEEQAQKSCMDGFIQKIFQPSKYGHTSMDEVLENTVLPWNMKQHLVDVMFTNQRRLKEEADTKSNPGEVRRLLLQLYADPDDPRKTYSDAPALESYRLGRISTPEYMLIRREVEQLKDGNSNSFQRRVNEAYETVHTAFTRGVEGSLFPGEAAEAAYRFRVDLDNAVQNKRNRNEDPRVLLDPASKEYVMRPDRLNVYLEAMRQNVSGKAGSAGQVAPSTFAPNQVYFINGKWLRFKGGNPKLSTSWEVAAQPSISVLK